MNIVIVGAGVVGQATGKGFARLGHDVMFYDIDAECCQRLKAEGYFALHNGSPIHSATDVVFFCVPEKAIKDSIAAWDRVLTKNPLFVIRSTVPPGTTEEVAKWHDRHICFNPEFLREAMAEYEFLNPPGIIIGSCCKQHAEMLHGLYSPLRACVIVVDRKTAELTKLCVNSYLACQISFWNQVNSVADSIGVNSHQIGMLASYCDERVSRYGARMHGKAYGGKCLPKDLQQMIDLCNRERVWTPLFQAIKHVNEAQEKKGG